MIKKNGKIEEDFNMFQKRKIYTIPDLYINGVPYKGTWVAKYIFKSICNGFLDDNNICGSENSPSSILYSRRINIDLIIILSLIIFFVVVLTLIYYRRCINYELENIFNNQIEEYAMKSISQYKSFPSSNSQTSKLEMT